MTIEQLLGHTTEQLEAMSDAELEAHLKDYFKYTRPERLDLLAPSKSKTKVDSDGEAAKQPKKPRAKKNDFASELAAMLKASGVSAQQIINK